MDLIDSQTSRVINKAMDGTVKRHGAIASNIANAETPGYKSIHVAFEDNLKQAIDAENNPENASRFLPDGSLKTTHRKHFNPKPYPTSTEDARYFIEQSDFSYRYDQNGVDMEKSMADLAKNTQTYMALSRLQAKSYNGLRNVIRGGGSS